MATAEMVYRAALALMDEPESYELYRERALAVINLLCGEAALRFGAASKEGERPAAREALSMEDALEVEETAARVILHYGLAAHLLCETSPATAGFYQQRYEELLRRAADAYPRRAEAIEDVYGGAGEDAPWR